jgi:hypothetical protein
MTEDDRIDLVIKKNIEDQKVVVIENITKKIIQEVVVEMVAEIIEEEVKILLKAIVGEEGQNEIQIEG